MHISTNIWLVDFNRDVAMPKPLQQRVQAVPKLETALQAFRVIDTDGYF
jgi:hypothetical protein